MDGEHQTRPHAGARSRNARTSRLGLSTALSPLRRRHGGRERGGGPPGAEVVAQNLTLVGEHGPVYREVSLEAPPGALVVVEGAAGSGRTALLLTIAGRMRRTGGTLAVGGRTEPRRIQGIAALGLINEVNPLDGTLSVREHLHERLRPRGLPWRRRHRDIVHNSLDRAGLDLSALPDGERTLARRLTRDQALRLGIALALLDAPRLLVVDDVDAGVPAAERHALWNTLRDVARDGLTVIAACTDPREALDMATVLIGTSTSARAPETAYTPAEDHFSVAADALAAEQTSAEEHASGEEHASTEVRTSVEPANIPASGEAPSTGAGTSALEGRPAGVPRESPAPHRPHTPDTQGPVPAPSADEGEIDTEERPL
jgi:ABC-2 type transport system ATP-binding protein